MLFARVVKANLSVIEVPDAASDFDRAVSQRTILSWVTSGIRWALLAINPN